MKKSWRILGAAAAIAAAFLLGACSDNVDDSTPETPTITAITITDGETAVGEDGVTLESTTGTKDLTVTVTGTGEFDKTFTAATSAEGVATVAVKEDGTGITITGVAAGEATITVTATGDNTKTATVKVTVPEATTPEPEPEPDTPVVSDGDATVTENASATGTQVKSAALSVSSGKLTGKLTLGNDTEVDITETDVSELSADGGTFEITANNVTYTATYTIADGKLTISQITGGEAWSTLFTVESAEGDAVKSMTVTKQADNKITGFLTLGNDSRVDFTDVDLSGVEATTEEKTLDLGNGYTMSYTCTVDAGTNNKHITVTKVEKNLVNGEDNEIGIDSEGHFTEEVTYYKEGDESITVTFKTDGTGTGINIISYTVSSDGTGSFRASSQVTYTMTSTDSWESFTATGGVNAGTYKRQQ